MNRRKLMFYIAVLYVLLAVSVVVNHMRNDADFGDTFRDLFWLTLIIGTVAGVAYWLTTVTKAVLLAGEAAKQQLKK